jgi:hypothetical protein
MVIIHTHTTLQLHIMKYQLFVSEVRLSAFQNIHPCLSFICTLVQIHSALILFLCYTLPYRRKCRLQVKGPHRRDGLRAPFSSALYVQCWWWVGEVRFNGHGVPNNLTFHRYNCGRCHTSDFSAKTFQ